MTSNETKQTESNACKTDGKGCCCSCGFGSRKLWLVLLPVAAVIGATAWFVCC